ncbi:zinc metalloproteinase precursor [Legionella geestiana]|uniref:Neutral metalloproteinase n=1 Tax=Legionella geestiana TaxID=45065 RepID=A0A0W0TZT0_9GAMM|nr:M4 family metallopeptidase [Legionella geestiana]KTD00973.1 zinc metalloproteinase precursor [Legionella geestiana]QBS12002.1 peptidase M4 family protein [Legionella geestiana]QDQ40388.1 M4 family metallopeptidase [Legionella geestiana]STX53281.1 zinc metalloproteinase precursor [Legionella geestiana]
MYKKILFSLTLTLAHSAMAASLQELYQTPLSALDGFNLVKLSPKASVTPSSTGENTLQEVGQTRLDGALIRRYQQYFRGIPVVGAQVAVREAANARAAVANGLLVNAISLETRASVSQSRAKTLAKAAWFAGETPRNTRAEAASLQIRMTDDNTPRLTWLVTFETTDTSGLRAIARVVIDAQNGEVLNAWNNLQTIAESGPGGNEKVKGYWYGLDANPTLDVPSSGAQCTMDNALVRLVRLNHEWDEDGKILGAFSYPCGQNTEDRVNGAFSPGNDAYYFANTVVDMYKNWYGLHALQKPDGSFMQLITRVHFGEKYDNAFWDSKTLTFGDGDALYPLTSLDIVGHEATHGFTEQHAGLEYHDQPGALNESMSDMAGMAARAFLLQTNPAFYNKTHVTPNALTWTIGESVMKGSGGAALRYMDKPSKDGDSADCVDATLAKKSGESCGITWSRLMLKARIYYPDYNQRQSYIVHTASGIFNKAFYLLSKSMGVREAYKLMLRANMVYWTPTSSFESAACGVRRAAKDLNMNAAMVKLAFDKVGIQTSKCTL